MSSQPCQCRHPIRRSNARPWLSAPEADATNSPVFVQEAEPGARHPSWQPGRPETDAGLQDGCSRSQNQGGLLQAPIPPLTMALTGTVCTRRQFWRLRGTPTRGPDLESCIGGLVESCLAHVQLYWSTDYDYRLNSDIAYGGDFEEAVSRLLDQFSAVKPQPYGQLHRNPETGAVLVINTYGLYN